MTDTADLPTVEEARAALDRWIWGVPTNPEMHDRYMLAVGRFEAAVREDERERARELVMALLEADNLTGILDPDQDDTAESRSALEHLNHVFSRALKELQP